MTASRSRERFARVREVFEELVDLPPLAQAERLERLERTEAELAVDVRGLLAAASQSPEFLERPANAVELEGRDLGAWRIEARIASGGMGDVYRASRVADDQRWTAAVKVLRDGLDGAALIGMFRHERRTLAALSHPNIVSLLDLGTLENGRPYFVMEFVEGLPIDRHCAEVNLDLRSRLELFLVVCSAVEHAHHRLVVHCDLKPANVLVTRDGHPKLLDFGIAELLTSSGAQHPLPITPGYSSPEQVRGEPITVASDVWSLGVLLDELASGRRARDLDAIVSKALAPSPAERYPSVGELVRDVRAYLDTRPVSARKSTLFLRASRFVLRNPWAAIASALAVLSLSLAVVLAARELSRARGEARVGWSAHAQAVEVTRLLEDLLLQAQRRADSTDDSWERTLDEAALHLGESFAGSPETLGRLRITFGALYVEMGRFEKARAQLEQALAIAGASRGFGRPDLERAQELLERTRAAR